MILWIRPCRHREWRGRRLPPARQESCAPAQASGLFFSDVHKVQLSFGSMVTPAVGLRFSQVSGKGTESVAMDTFCANQIIFNPIAFPSIHRFGYSIVKQDGCKMISERIVYESLPAISLSFSLFLMPPKTPMYRAHKHNRLPLGQLIRS